jgi:hypothetical protein
MATFGRLHFLSCKLTLLGLSFFLYISPRDSGEVSHVAVESAIPAITVFDSPLRFSSSVRRERTRFGSYPKREVKRQPP